MVVTSEKLAKGTNLLWVTLPLALVFLLYQVKLLLKLFGQGFFRAFFNQQANFWQRLSWTLVVGGGMAITCFILFLNFMYHYGGGVPDWLAGNKDSIVTSTTLLAKVWTVIMALLLGAIVSSTLLIVLLLGPWVVGLNVCAAIHNYANGQEIDFGMVYNVLFHSKLSATLALLLNVGSFALSVLLSSRKKEVYSLEPEQLAQSPKSSYQ